MKKGNVIVLLSSILALASCGATNVPAESSQSGSSSEAPVVTSSSEAQPEGKLKEIALRSSARTTLSVTDRISTSILYELKANKGQSLKTADKKVIVTSSDPETLFVENTSAALSTFLDAKKPGQVKLTIQSNLQPDKILEIDMTVIDSVFDRQMVDGFFGNSWENVDFSHEVDETDPYIKTVAEEEINHQFYFRDSFVAKSYAECEFTFLSERDGTAHLPKIGFVFSTQEENDTNRQSVSFIYFDTDCRNGNSTFYNIGYNEIANGVWGWDTGAGTLAKSYGVYRHEAGVQIGEKFKIGIAKEGYNYHVYFNDVYVKSIEMSIEGFSKDSSHTEAAPSICGLFDFKSEVIYSNYLFSTDEELINSKIPATPDFSGIDGTNYQTPQD